MTATKDFIEGLSRDDFFYNYVRRVANDFDFSRVMTLGIDYIDAKAKKSLRSQIVSVGMPAELVNTDKKLEEAIFAIGARAVEVR